MRLNAFWVAFLTTLLPVILLAGHVSDRSVSIALSLNKNEARLYSYTLKNHAFAMATLRPVNSYYEFGHPIPLNIRLSNEQGLNFVRELYVGALCFDHEPSEPPHVLGDTILLHEDTFVIEMPEIKGYDTVSIELPIQENGVGTTRVLGSFKLDHAHFDESIHGFTYKDLVFSNKKDKRTSVIPTASTVWWPEHFGDSTTYKVYGIELESSIRINVVIVPDGYQYSEKAIMEQHAQDLVQAFRNKTPFREHDHLINYILVYAYSKNSGTDQCDCGIVLNTAMGTGFQRENPVCGSRDNRCLYYTNPCDAPAQRNIVAAEQRAPFADTTIIMVNTNRYGGCGGGRAVYSAGNAAAGEVAIHELGHSLAGLADEYGGSPSCGSYASGINTSVNATQGDWSEWIADIGFPRQGGQYYEQCIYRPESTCEMRTLNAEFCHICNQHFSRIFYGHPRVSPTAPMYNVTPSQTSITVPQSEYMVFRYNTRLSNQPTVQNSSSFYVKAPGDEDFTKLPVSEQLWIRFIFQGDYQIKAEVIADTNLVKPQKSDTNKDTVIWHVAVGLSNNKNRSLPHEPSEKAYEILSEKP